MASRAVFLVMVAAVLVVSGCGSAYQSPLPKRTSSTAEAAELASHVPGSQAGDATQVGELARITRSTLSAYTQRDVGSRAQYWTSTRGFVVDSPTIRCWYCWDTPATAAALLSTGDVQSASLRHIAVDTWSMAIRKYLTSSGEITNGNQSNGVGTGFFAVQLGLTYLILRDRLPARTRMLWKGAMVRMAAFLKSSGQLDDYINGNVNLRQAEVMWLAWAITHQRTYLDLFRAEMRFTIDPTQPRWRGYGLRLTHGTAIGGRFTSGYLTETDGMSPGFDPSYTQLQLDTATQMYVLSHNREDLVLANLEFNQLRPRVTPGFILNAHGGTRKNDIVPFLSPAPFVLSVSGERPGLRSYWLKQLAVIRIDFLSSETFSSAGFYNEVSNSLVTALLRARYPDGILSAPCSKIRSAVCKASG